MTTQVQLRRGTTAQHTTFTGALGEVTVDTDLKTLRVHDGSTAGGSRIAKFSDIPSTLAFTLSADDSAGQTVATDGTGVLRFSGLNSITTSSDSAGTVSIELDKSIDINEISSSDSSAIQINDAVNIVGALNVSSSIEIGNGPIITEIADEDTMSSDSATKLATQQSIKAYVDAQDANIASDTLTLTNKTFDANGTGNSLSNIETADFASAAFKDEDNMASNSATAVASQQSIKAYVDSEISTLSSGTVATATEATNVTVTANNTANETVFITFVDGATGTQGIETDTNLTYNPSTNVLSTTASQAQYADLAERYTSDQDYSEGHVVVLGGSEQITESTQENDTRIAGVISEKYAYLMNHMENGPAVALKGKVPCKVVGTVSKGDLLVSSSTPGHAVASSNPNPSAVLGRSMVDDQDTHPRLITIKI